MGLEVRSYRTLCLTHREATGLGRADDRTEKHCTQQLASGRSGLSDCLWQFYLLSTDLLKVGWLVFFFGYLVNLVNVLVLFLVTRSVVL